VPQLPPEVLQAAQLAMTDIERIAGLSAYEMSNAPSKRLTQDEAQAIALSGSSRAVADRQTFETFCSEIASRFLGLEQQYSVRSRELPIFGRDEKVTGFDDFTRAQIQGRYLVEVHVGSTSAPKSENVTEQVAFLIQTLPNFVTAMQTAAALGLDLRPVLPRLIRAALPDARDVEQTLLQQLEQAPPMMPPGATGVPAPVGAPGPGDFPPELAGAAPPELTSPGDLAPAGPQALLTALLGQGV
jgi:hypothetical protein